MNKSEYPRCKTCKFAESEVRDYEYIMALLCNNTEKISEDYPNYKIDSDSLNYTTMRDGKFIVGENFGCIHHEEKE